MTPIEKNIIVVDENGKEYEATYPKRAKGLVKNGRARFIDKNTICLACPPKNELEDIKMSENNVKANVEIPTENDTSISKYNIPYVLEQIEKLHTELQSLEETVKSIQSITDVKQNSITNTPDEEEHEVTREVVESVAISKVDAIVEIFHQREESLRKLLAFYEKMYDDLKHKNDKNGHITDFINSLLDPNTPLITKNHLKEILQSYFQTP